MLYDYIIVGAGPAGCALAGRLAEGSPRARIALVESGGAVMDRPDVIDPSRWPCLLGAKPIDYAYLTVPQPALQGFSNHGLYLARVVPVYTNSMLTLTVSAARSTSAILARTRTAYP